MAMRLSGSSGSSRSKLELLQVLLWTFSYSGLHICSGGTDAGLRGTHMTVLVIDDDPNVTEMIRDALLSNGYRCLIASSAEEADALLVTGAQLGPDQIRQLRRCGGTLLFKPFCIERLLVELADRLVKIAAPSPRSAA